MNLLEKNYKYNNPGGLFPKWCLLHVTGGIFLDQYIPFLVLLILGDILKCTRNPEYFLQLRKWISQLKDIMPFEKAIY